MEGLGFRDNYRSNYGRYGYPREPDYCNIRGPKRGSSTAALRQPYRAAVPLEDEFSSPVQNMLRRFYPKEEVPSYNYIESPREVLSRNEHSKNRIEPTHETLPSRERKEQECPLRRYERAYANFAPTNLFPTVKPSEAFREDVLKVMNPIISKLKQDLQGSVAESSPVPRLNIEEASRPKNDTHNENEVLDRLQKLENEFKKLARSTENDNESHFRDLESLTQKVNKLESNKPQPCQCKCKDLNVAEKLDDVNRKLQSLQKDTEGLKNLDRGTDNKEDITKLSTKIKELDKKESIMSSLVDDIATRLEELQNEVGDVPQNVNQKLDKASRPDLTQFNFVNEERLKKAMSDLEKKMPQSHTEDIENIQGCFNELQDYVMEFEQKSNKKISDLTNTIKGKCVK